MNEYSLQSEYDIWVGVILKFIAKYVCVKLALEFEQTYDRMEWIKDWYWRIIDLKVEVKQYEYKNDSKKEAK